MKTIEQLVAEKVAQAKAMPDTDIGHEAELFYPCNNKAIIVAFFGHVQKYLTHEKFVKRLETVDRKEWDKTPGELFLVLNSPSHPVRNGMILISCNCLD